MPTCSYFNAGRGGDRAGCKILSGAAAPVRGGGREIAVSSSKSKCCGCALHTRFLVAAQCIQFRNRPSRLKSCKTYRRVFNYTLDRSKTRSPHANFHSPASVQQLLIQQQQIKDVTWFLIIFTFVHTAAKVDSFTRRYREYRAE